MKTRINLLTSTERFHKHASYWHQFKIISLITGIFVTVTIAAALYIKNNNAIEIKKLQESSEQISFSLDNQGDIQKQKKLANRLSLISDIVGDGVDYHQALIKIDKHLNRYQLNNVTVNSNKEVTIQLTLKNKQVFLEFTDLLQSLPFRADFTDIKMNKFIYPANDDPINNYSFSAKVKI